ncbi:hypothetical protein FRC07_013548 [Ceratobasidium sp. 392]|nr:hypothetical protein FRC07_013548 [Ceratobasidium sp. 392]
MLDTFTQTTVVPSSQILPPETGSLSTPPSPAPLWSYGMEVGSDVSPKPRRRSMIYISLQNRVYHVPVESLARPSEVLDDMFSIADSSTEEGSNPSKPLVLDNLASVSEWNAYLSYASVDHHTIEVYDEPPREHWYDLLAIGHKFQAPGAVRYAKAKLEASDTAQDPLPATLRLHLGRLYKFSDWIELAAPRIAITPIQDFPASDYSLLGTQTLYMLIQLHVRLQSH